jgi:hypothetical protein
MTKTTKKKLTIGAVAALVLMAWYFGIAATASILYNTFLMVLLSYLVDLIRLAISQLKGGIR